MKQRKKINLQKIDFLDKLKNSFLEDSEFSTSKNEDLIMISNITKKIVLYELNKNQGMALSIPLGKYKIPKNSWMTVGSILMMDPDTANVAITLYSDENFKNDVGFFTNIKDTKIENTTSSIVGENKDGSPIFYDRTQLIKSIRVEYLMYNKIYFANKRRPGSLRFNEIPTFTPTTDLSDYLYIIKGPIKRIIVELPRTLLIVYGKFTNSWGQEEERIAGYIYNENYDKPKDVTYLYDTSKNKIDLELIDIKATNLINKHLTDELYKKYKV